MNASVIAFNVSTQAEQAQLRERITTLERNLQDVLAQIARLMETEE